MFGVTKYTEDQYKKDIVFAIVNFTVALLAMIITKLLLIGIIGLIFLWLNIKVAKKGLLLNMKIERDILLTIRNDGAGALRTKLARADEWAENAFGANGYVKRSYANKLRVMADELLERTNELGKN